MSVSDVRDRGPRPSEVITGLRVPLARGAWKNQVGFFGTGRARGTSRATPRASLIDGESCPARKCAFLLPFTDSRTYILYVRYVALSLGDSLGERPGDSVRGVSTLRHCCAMLWIPGKIRGPSGRQSEAVPLDEPRVLLSRMEFPSPTCLPAMLSLIHSLPLVKH